MEVVYALCWNSVSYVPHYGWDPQPESSFQILFSDMLLSRADGYRGKANTKKLMLGIFSEIIFFNIYKAVRMHNLLKYTQIHSSKQPP